MLILESFKYLRVLIFVLLSMFGLWYLDPFLVLQLITDIATTNIPDMVDDILPRCPNLIYTPFLAIAEDILSQGTAHLLVIIFRLFI